MELLFLYTLSLAAFFISILSIGSLTFWVGGWEWCLVAVTALISLSPIFNGPLNVAAMSGLSLCWLLAFYLTEDRRLFFPYTMQFAVQVFSILSGRSMRLGVGGATGIIVLFSAIRLIQSASLIVLAVELVVAGMALWIAGEFYRRGADSPVRRLIAAGLGSILAFAGLIF